MAAATPNAKRLAKERGVDLDALQAPGGRALRAADVPEGAAAAPAGGGAAAAAPAGAQAALAPAAGRQARLTPLARRMAEAQGLDPSSVQGRGVSGRVYAADLAGARPLAAAQAPAPVQAPEPAAPAAAREMPPAAPIAAQPAAPVPAPVEAPAPAPVEAPAPAPVEAPALALVEAPAPVVASAAAPAPAPAQAAPAPKAPLPEGVTEVPMNGMRRVIAQRMAQSARETAVVNQFVEMDVTALLTLRAAVNEGKAKTERLTVTAFILRAMAVATREQERFRMQLNEAGDGFLLFEKVDIGIAVGTQDGLTVPVLRDADKKSIYEINQETAALTVAARAGRLMPDDYKGGVITLTNMGMYGVTAFTPIINQPEAAILGMGKPTERLVMEGASIRNKAFMFQSLTYDHRIINGTESALFQLRLKELLEKPKELL
jgi:pyruvate/2-oxoglutarate dehydrogenase complex dihydrolipoamide acyltransferase (E2) component